MFSCLNYSLQSKDWEQFGLCEISEAVDIQRWFESVCVLVCLQMSDTIVCTF